MKRFGWAWVALSVALAIHVADEAATDFLSFYNPMIRALRARAPFLPLPTFTFGTWLTGLVLAVILLLSLSTFAFRGARWIVRLAYAYGILMVANSMGHLLGSLYFGRLLPGVYSAPLLLAASCHLLAATHSLRGKAPGG